MTTIPEPNDNMAINCLPLTPEHAKKLYKTFVAEFNQLSLQEKIAVLTCRSNDDPISYINGFTILQYIDGSYMTHMLPITMLTPDTFTQYIQYHNICNEETLLKLLDNGNPDRKGGISVYVADLTDSNQLKDINSVDTFSMSFSSFDSLTGISNILRNFASNGQSSYEIFETFNPDEYYLCRVRLNDYFTFSDIEADYYFLLDKDSEIINNLNELQYKFYE